MKGININKRKCAKALFISFGILLCLVALTALVINIYTLIIINEMSATTTSKKTEFFRKAETF